MPTNKNDNFIFNVAADEAEACLMADRVGFSEYYSIDINEKFLYPDRLNKVAERH